MALSTISGTTGITDATITSAKLADFSAAVDLNGVELLLDADQDTSISADTDDQIDIKIGGADDFQFTANTFTALSGSTIKANTIAETTSTSGVTIDGVLLKDGVLGANTVDSDAYVDGSIDTAHIANDQITAALMADNSIDSDMYVDGSIDLAHMSSESVDEDNLYISNSGSNGQFLSKQSGNNGGLTWASAALAGIDDQSSSNDDQLTITDTAIIINEDSDDLDFRIESNVDTHAFFVDGADSAVKIKGQSSARTYPAAGGGILRIDDNAGEGGAGAVGNHGGGVVFGVNDGSINNYFTGIKAHLGDGGGNTAGHLSFYTRSATSDSNLSEKLEIKNNGQTMFTVDTGVAPMGTFQQTYDGGDSYINVTNESGAADSLDERAGINFNLYNNSVAIWGYKVDDGTSGAKRDAGLQFHTQDSNSLVNRFQISNNGTLLGQDTSIGSLSDQRLKENIADLTYSLDTFKALKPKTFTWKNTAEHPGDGTRRGFIAQDLVGVDNYWIEEHTAQKIPDQVLEAATYYEEGDSLPAGKNIGDVKTAATYTYQYAKDDGSDYDLLDDGSALANKFLAAKLGKKDAMYVSVIKQLITKIETLETKVQALEDA